MASPAKKTGSGKAKKATTPKPAAKKTTAAKTVVVGARKQTADHTPRHRKTGEKYKAPKLVQAKLSRDEQIAADNFRIKGQ